MSFLQLDHLPHKTMRNEITRTSLRMNELGINQGKSGNVSVRIDNGFLVTPTGIAYEETKPEQIVAMTLDGTHEGGVLPSSEWRFHRDIYASRADAGTLRRGQGRSREAGCRVAT